MASGDTAGGATAGSLCGSVIEKFVILSGVRPGLKRELAFSLKSQAEVSATIGRTRLRRSPSSVLPAANPSASDLPNKKRARKTLISNTSASPAREIPVVGAPVSDSSLADGRRGSSAETPIVIEDLHARERVTEDLVTGREAEVRSKPPHAENLVVPSWLEQQVSRITQTASKYVIQGTVEGASDSSDDGRAHADSRRANINIRLRSPESVLDSIESTSRSIPSIGTTNRKLTRKDLSLHKLVFMKDILPDGTLLRYVVNGSPKLVGYAKESGIYCTCCNVVVSPSQFEAHAGESQRRKPYNYIYTSNGVSLHELSVMLSKCRKLLDSDNDDLCSICEDAGELVLCDLCPRSFHKECLGLPSIPEGDWHCQYCVNMHKKDKYVAHNDNARAAGRVAGVDAIDQILKRSILIVKVPDAWIGGCALCRCKDYAKSGFGPRTVLICDQCEKEYHVGCLKISSRDNLKEKPKGDWFCCTDCISIHASLQDTLYHGAQALPDLALDMIKQNEIVKCSKNDANVGPKLRLFRGKTTSASDKLFLSAAVSILHESFDPIIGGRKGSDLVTQMVYGRCWENIDFQGMYCAMLTVDSSVLSVGILRVLGSETAELPLVATRKECQGQGYFRALFACIGRLLASLNVKHLVLPATDEAESMWTKKFGFTKITEKQLSEYAKGIKIVNFEGTTLLQRTVSELLPDFGNQGN